ncbi:tetratricopeptide repeat protein [Ponticaulis sp.]|uniref:tetratricopeptide repeat protein n=1 Tax=Ponticaulis sp. TaxID=2020902 RepID=UPI000B63C4E1|nr:tetratricopeptide repeat protein [Ponticaulis sp.]MAI89608.1 hypothetical protein [Ponticaulis sp.]OUY00633.1 MAG: hypothetical protein CBB65_04150 [Hyphomonadaceae bacterium TMED5]
MSDIFQEVDEALAQDTSHKYWKILRPFVYGTIAIVVVGVGVWEFLKWQGAQTQEDASSTFYQARAAQQANDYVAAEALLQEIADSDSPYAVLSAHFLAQVELSGLGDRAGAIAALEEASAGNGPFAEMAALKAAYLQAGTMSVPELEEYLSPVLNSQSMALSYLGEELVASRAYELGDLEDARRRFNMISVSLDASDATQQRAQRALAALDVLEQLNPNTQTDGDTQ